MSRNDEFRKKTNVLNGSSIWFLVLITIKPVHKGHSRKPVNVALNEQLSFIYRLKLYAQFINEKNETVLYRQ